MSIALVFIGTDGILLATDSRMTVGTDINVDYWDDNSQKLWKLTDNLGLTSVGSQQGYRQHLIEICQRRLKESGVDNLSEKAISLLTDIVRVDYMHQLETLGILAKEFLRNKFGVIVGGYDDDDKPTILSIRAFTAASDIPFATDIRRLFWIDSASGIAEHLLIETKMIEELRHGLSLNVLKRLAALFIEETKISNNCIGGKIQMATVTKDGGFQFVGEGDVKSVTEDANIFIANKVEYITK